MKKKIAVVFSRMIVGGAEKALIQFLLNIDSDRYDVTLFTLNDSGALLEEIPSYVCVHYIEVKDSASILWSDLSNLKLVRFIKGAFIRVVLRLCKDHFLQFALPMLTYPKIPGIFDCAIAYKLGCEDIAVLLTRVKANKKIAFVHGMPEEKGVLYKSLNSICRLFCVSKKLKDTMDELFPYLEGKTEVFHNLIDADEILTQARRPMDCGFSKNTIVTVGRLSPEKGQQMIPKSTRILLDQGYEIYWYLVGDGPLRAEVEQEIKKYDVQDHVILLGTKMNPYPYIKNCDIYVQPSFTEGWGLTVQEARILEKPIVVTPIPVMEEQIRNGENGLIVEAMTPEAIADGILQLLDHPELMEKFTNALKNETFDNSAELQKLYDLIES